MIVSASPDESSRFALRIGRAWLEAAPGVSEVSAAIADYDVVILRAPAELREIGLRLASASDFVLLPADHLCFWNWVDDRVGAFEMPGAFSLRPARDAEEVRPLIFDAFSNYGNHYRANPLFDPDDVVAGYCEWVESLLAQGAATCLVLESSDGLHGFGIIDWSTDTPDIRLAGMISASQGRGLYPAVLHGLMREARDRKRSPIMISTQSDNIIVMRAWARLGWLPVRTLVTHHLVRRALLAP